jgi:hypothetical protein
VQLERRTLPTGRDVIGLCRQPLEYTLAIKRDVET